MEKQKVKTVEELLRKAKYVSKSKPSCVLTGKASMRGPGVKDDPFNDTESEEVCNMCPCGGQIHGADFRTCKTCKRDFHNSCFKVTTNAAAAFGVMLCSQCWAGIINSPINLLLGSELPLYKTCSKV